MVDDEVASAVFWCIEQAEGIMSTTAGAATCDGDPTGVLQYVNSMASDIAINLQMLASRLGEEVPPSNEAEHPAPAEPTTVTQNTVVGSPQSEGHAK